MPQSPQPVRTRLRIVVLTVLVCSFVGAAHAQTYWFETYQRAVQLIDADKSAEAAPILDELIQSHPFPQASMRIPGHQYLDYLPYYQLARIQTDQKDYREASHNLKVSEAFGAVKYNKRTKADFTALRALLDSELAEMDGPPTLAAEKK